MRRSILLAAGPAMLAILALAPPAGGQTAPPAAAEPCMSCHGAPGLPAAPNLAGQKAGYLEAQLKAFKAKTRTSAFMNPIAAQLSDEDMHALALFWAALPATPVVQGGAIASTMKLPAGFPAGFVQYQDKPGLNEGRTRRYANAVAVKAAKAGQPLPQGSIVIGVAYDKSGAITGYEGMESRKDWPSAAPALLRNGDFQYGRFDKAGQPAPINQVQCLACHKGKEADSFMFTRKELGEAKD